ncbi:hypothetical protein H2200_007437 [Cladophialophora chaetospira]|uniref:Uncharacterized protein n=1 Tax=Cladophialophora chaetospira TaxID=386627 RepID=A0AA38X7Z8_9EURO|nr:hypothetical protein H2200_007437 [Cladophialophora chaetospira]
MSSTKNPTVARTPAFFKHCNEVRTYLRTEHRVIEAFELLGVRPEVVKEVAKSARTIWTARNGPTPVNLGKKDAAVTRRREEAEAELRDQCPAVFQIACVEENEERFVRARAPDALIVLANMTLQRLAAWQKNKDTQASRAGSEDVAEEPTTDVDDTEMEDVSNVNEDFNMQTITTAAERSRTPVTATTKPDLFTGPPFSIEVRTAKKGLSMLKLEWKYVLGDGGVPSYDILQNIARAFPHINWQKNILFIHVVNNTNIFIFEQSTLESAFAAWRHRAPAADTFLLYANDYEGLPSTQIPGEASSDK